MLRILPTVGLLMLISGGPAMAYSCTLISILSKRCVCTTEADCHQMGKDNVCGTPSMLCNAKGSRCSCTVSRFHRPNPPASLSPQ